jgi:mannose-6-phosphate isomerase-like protein (cupin superfamily)
MPTNRPFNSYSLTHGLLADRGSYEFPTQLWGWNDEALSLPATGTHFGYVHQGGLVILDTPDRGFFVLKPGMYFSLPSAGTLLGDGQGIVVTRLGYQGVFSIGGPIEPNGRLRYIDGCRDSLLIPPVMKGDPCLNALYFPAAIDQTPHTHPSIRVGMVVSGRGECITPDEVIPLEPGQVFVIPANGLHSFRTEDSAMLVVAWHPDSDCGPTHESHPMLNRTWVNGVSAMQLEEIKTRA